MGKHSKKHRAPSSVGTLLVMAVCATLVFVMTSLFFSMITYLLSDPAAAIPVLSLPAFLVSGAITALVIGRRGKDGLLKPLLAVLLFLFLLLLIGVIAAHGTLSWQILLYDIGYLLAFLIVYLLSTMRRGHHGRRFRE